MKCSYADRCDFAVDTPRSQDGPAHVVVLDIRTGAEEVWHEKCHSLAGCEVCKSTSITRESW